MSFPKHILCLLLLCAVSAPAVAQRFVAGVDFTTRFDNREYSGTPFAEGSETFFSARLTPCAGLRWAGDNELIFGVDLLQDFGDDARFLTAAKPKIWYRYASPHVEAAAGIFPRELLSDSYGEAFFDRSWLFYHNRVQGVMARYRGERSNFVELAIDWEGMQSATQREKCRILSAGEAGGRFLYGGYALTVLHYAKTSAPGPDEGVVDNILVNPYAGGRFTAFFDFDIRVGYLQSLQRDRRLENGWTTPKGGVLDVRMSRWGLTLANMCYVGENLMPFYDLYGGGLYANACFYGTREHLYNRTEVSYDRRFFNGTLGVRAALFFHCDGRSMGMQQLLEVNVSLGSGR